MTDKPNCLVNYSGEYYTCDTCSENMRRSRGSFGGIQDKLYICKPCIETCHKGHKVRVAGRQSLTCECPLSYCKVSCKCCRHKQKCTSLTFNNTRQRSWPNYYCSNFRSISNDWLSTKLIVLTH